LKLGDYQDYVDRTHRKAALTVTLLEARNHTEFKALIATVAGGGTGTFGVGRTKTVESGEC